MKVGGWDERYSMHGEWLIYYKIASAGRLVVVHELDSFYDGIMKIYLVALKLIKVFSANKLF